MYHEPPEKPPSWSNFFGRCMFWLGVCLLRIIGLAVSVAIGMWIYYEHLETR